MKEGPKRGGIAPIGRGNETGDIIKRRGVEIISNRVLIGVEKGVSFPHARVK